MSAHVEISLRPFAALYEVAREALFAAGIEVRYRPRQTIHRQGDKDRSLQVILEGRVRFSRLDAQGRQTNIGMLGAGESFGEIPLLTGRPRTHDAFAVGTVRLLRISDVRFRELLTQNPNMRDRLLAELAEKLVHTADRLDSVLRMSVPQRVAQFLVAEVEQGHGERSIDVRQVDIAESLGATREAVAAALRSFRDAGLVQTRYRSIEVVDLETLRSAIETTMPSPRSRKRTKQTADMRGSD